LVQAGLPSGSIVAALRRAEDEADSDVLTTCHPLRSDTVDACGVDG
jgi:hypothetical protein